MTSGIYQYDLTLNDVAQEAYEILQSAGSGETLDDSLLPSCVNTLNRMIKMWEAQGIHLWTYTQYTLFFQIGQGVYDFTDASTRLVNEFSSTALTADASALDSIISVESVEDIELGYAIGVINDSNDLFWSVVEAISGTDVTLRDALSVDSGAGNIVRTYQTADRFQTTAAAAQVATDQEVQLASQTGAEAGMIIQITQDDGTVLHTTINSIDEDTDIALLDAPLTAAVTIGNDIVMYTSEQNFIPLSRILPDMVRRHSGENSDYEIPIIFESRKDYKELPNKNIQGTPIQAYYSRQEPQGIMYFWNVPSTAIEYCNFDAERQLQIMSGDPDETFDLPSEWYDALVYNTAKRLIHKVGCSQVRRQEIRQDADDYLTQALAFDTAVYPIRIRPQRYGRR